MDPNIIVGVGFIISGLIFYYRNYRNPAQKTPARLGLALIVIGIVLAFGDWLFEAAYTNRY